MDELSGKVAIVTGAGRMRGMGRATAIALARAGADVVVTGTGRQQSSLPPDEQQAGWRDVGQRRRGESGRSAGAHCRSGSTSRAALMST